MFITLMYIKGKKKTYDRKRNLMSPWHSSHSSFVNIVILRRFSVFLIWYVMACAYVYRIKLTRGGKEINFADSNKKHATKIENERMK